MNSQFTFRMIPPIAMLVCCGVVNQGCSDLLKQPYPAKAYFGIETGLPDSTAKPGRTTAPATRPAADVLLVRNVRITPPFDGLGFVYQTGPAKYSTDYYVNWVAAPSALLTGDLINWLDAAGPLPIAPAGSTVRPKYVLETEVTRLVVDRAPVGKARAIVAARFS